MKAVFCALMLSAIPSSTEERTAIKIVCGDVFVIAGPASEPTLGHIFSMAQCLQAPPTCTVETVKVRDTKTR